MAHEPTVETTSGLGRLPRWGPLSLLAILAFPLGACSDAGPEGGGPLDPQEPDEPPAAVLVGTVEVLGAGAPAGAEVVGRWGAVEGRDDVGSGGVFELELDREPGTAGFVGIRPQDFSDAVSALLRVETPLPRDTLRVLLLPSVWTVQAGVHAGTEVQIHPADGAQGLVLPSYWGFTFPFDQEGREQTILDRTRWTGALVTWPPDAFPLPVALDRNASTSELTSSDSLRLWETLTRFEEVLGRDLFRAARVQDLPAPDPDRDGAIPEAVLVRVDSTLSLRGRGSGDPLTSTWLRSENVETWSGSSVTRLSVVSADARFGMITVQAPDVLEDPALVMHEAMHVLGVGHGCVWRSVQTYCESLAANEPTPEDVAYLEVLEAAREREKALGTTLGILPAVLGERALERGESPIPEAMLVDPGSS